MGVQAADVGLPAGRGLRSAVEPNGEVVGNCFVEGPPPEQLGPSVLCTPCGTLAGAAGIEQVSTRTFQGRSLLVGQPPR